MKLIERVLEMKRNWDTEFIDPPRAILAGPIEYVGLRDELIKLCDETSYLGIVGLAERPYFRGEFKVINILVKPKMTPGLDFELNESQCMELASRTIRDSLRVV